MCEPTTIMTLAATAVSAGLAVAQGYAQKSSYDQQAENMRLLGRQQLDAASVEADQVRAAGRRELGHVRAIQGASGVDLSSGSAADVGANIAQQEELKALHTMYQGRLGNWQQQYAADVAKTQGKAAVIGGYTQAAGTVLGAAIKGGFFDSPTTGTAARTVDPRTGRKI
jgi:hypothetical protein